LSNATVTATIDANGIEITYATYGDPAAPPLLAIHGLGAQMTDFPDYFVDGMVDAGYYVITFDNRDQGLSTWFDTSGVPEVEVLLTDPASVATYLLADMAADAAGLLDALGLDSVHVLGVSMGGMIAQQFAIDFPERTRTLTSIMSTPGPTTGPPTPEATAALLVEPSFEREAAIDQSVATGRVIASTGFPFDEPGFRARAAVHFDRGHHPDGTVRQLAAILASPDRTERLGAVTVPTLVVHGSTDPLVTLPGGEATAAAIPGAELWVVEGMGHDLPVEILPELSKRQGALLAQVG
jgi:pimeloyl-ACP methyl ester carboxylesterase